MHALELERVSFSYSDGFGIEGLDLQIAPGSFLGLIGPNGSGKTTLLGLMSGLLHPASGRIRLEGKDLGEIRRHDMARVMAVISSEHFFEFPFTAWEVVEMGRFPHHGRFQTSQSEDRRVILEALEMTNAAHLRDRPISTLSSGERQRVLIARALAQQPRILLLDEPNAHLDVHHQLEIFRLLETLTRRHATTVVVVLHDLNVAAAFCREVALMRGGRLVGWGSPYQVITTNKIREVYGAGVTIHTEGPAGYPVLVYDREGEV